MKTRISRAGINFWIDALAFLVFMICAISGYAIMGNHHGEDGIQPTENGADIGSINEDAIWGIARFEWGHIHNLTGWILVALVIVHLITHRRWISIMTSKSIRRRR